jgi:hypothetical protein
LVFAGLRGAASQRRGGGTRRRKGVAAAAAFPTTPASGLAKKKKGERERERKRKRKRERERERKNALPSLHPGIGRGFASPSIPTVSQINVDFSPSTLILW